MYAQRRPRYKFTVEGLIRSGVTSGFYWGMVTFMVSFTMVNSPVTPDALQTAAMQAIFSQIITFAEWAALFGLTLPLAIARMASRAEEAMDDGRMRYTFIRTESLRSGHIPHETFPSTPMSTGQVRTFFPVVLLGIVSGVLYMLLLFPYVMTPLLVSGIELRLPLLGAFVAGVGGLMGGSCSHWVTFRFNRKDD
jgi:hypothetical protein